MAASDIKNLEKRMQGALDNLQREFGGLRAGRAHVSLLEPVVVESYGATMPLNQVGTVASPDPRSLSVQVWDKSNVSAVEKGIRNANLGLNPVVDGQIVRVPIPELTEERRLEMVKVAGSYSENAKVAIRNIRRDGMDQAKQAPSEDEGKQMEDEVQKLTDSFVKHVDDMLSDKRDEITQV